MLDRTQIKELGQSSNAWPFVEARKILERINNTTPKKGYVLFETGYGPSGLPHLGTFGEVARTTMVRFAFSLLSDIPTKLYAFSDDLDGLRKVPTNVPNQDLLAKHLGLPLTKVPDPFGLYNSFGEHNNNKLQEFLDSFGFEYEFKSSTECYKSGLFNDALLKVLEKYDDILKAVLPTLGEERRQTYSPFLPIDQKSGKVLQVAVIEHNLDKGTITYINEEGEKIATKVTDGACKLQWKVDWAMRWYALDVDYEMSGKDLIPSVELSSKICSILGKKPPLNFTYELFLDKNGEKISKSKGNGLSIEEWLRYGNKESLAYFMYQKPQTAKRLFLEIVPKNIDDWLTSIVKYNNLTLEQQLQSPIFFIHNSTPPQVLGEINFSLILNLVSVVGDNKELLWNYINKYKTNIDTETKKIIDDLLNYAINYYEDFVKPTLNYKIPSEEERKYLQLLLEKLSNINEASTAEEIQTIVYQVGKDLQLELKDWFSLLYQTLLGQMQGPRMGTFFALYGIENSKNLIANIIIGKKL